MKKIFLFLLIFVLTSSIPINAECTAYRIHNYKGERVGTCKHDHDNNNHVYYLFDMNNKKVSNPASYMGEPANDCWLFDVDGIAIGKCTASRVIVWGRR